MRRLKTGVLFLLFSLTTACGQQVVEFPGDTDIPGTTPALTVALSLTPALTPAPSLTPAPATVVSTRPSDAATSVAVNAPVTAIFSTEMDPATVATAFTLKQGAASVAGDVAYLGTTATLTPASTLAPNSVFTATISTASKDIDGLALATDYTWSFTTDAHTISPTVIANNPVNAATNVSTNKRIDRHLQQGDEPGDNQPVDLHRAARGDGGHGRCHLVGDDQHGDLHAGQPAGTLADLYGDTLHRRPGRVGQLIGDQPQLELHHGGLQPDCRSRSARLRNFAVLAGSTVTSIGQTSVTGDLGVSSGTAITGFPPGKLIGAKHAGDPTAAQGIADLTTAYNDAAGRTLCPVTVAGNLGGQTLVPGLYKSTSSLAISAGDLTLDAKGDEDAVFIFQMASTLTTTAGRQVILTGGAKSANIFWQVGTSATFGTTSSFQGTVMADQAITLNTGATLNGRALARIGAVALDSNPIVKPAP